MTYGDVARAAGRPRAARAVGTLMRTTRVPGLPYHRVIAAGGRLGGYGGAELLKAGLLTAEGVKVRNGRIMEFGVRRLTVRVGQRAEGGGQRAEGKGQRRGQRKKVKGR
jgi:O-6-methylguanine DNA methyltransferase